MREKPKACPFCGSESTRVQFNEARKERRFYYVTCVLCGARTRGELFPCDEITKDNEWDNAAIDKSLTCWNQRAGEQNA